MFQLSKIKELIYKYSVATPRYTSYPTAIEFNSKVGNEAVIKTIHSEVNTKISPPLSLYLHVPFCRSLCYFCACNKVVTKDYKVVRPFIDALKGEINTYQELLRSDSVVEQFHWGGGSPNFLEPDESEEIFNLFKSSFSKFAPQADVSIEIDPRTVNLDKLTAYRKVGFNRVSLGVQDFNPAVQEVINRIQSFEDTRNTCEAVRALGFNSINLDLIYGLPNQTIETFRDTLKKVISIRPDRIALYGYAHVTWRTKVQNSFNKYSLPTPEERIYLFLLALSELMAEGYIYIGMDHFALPEDELTLAKENGTIKRNFMGYSTHQGNSLIGFGPSSVSTYQNLLAQNESDPSRYKDRISSEGLAISKGVERSAEDRIRAYVIEELLCYGKLNYNKFFDVWSLDFCNYFKEIFYYLKLLEVDTLIEISTNHIEITEMGRLFMRNIVSVFDSYLPKHLSLERQVFSQSI